MRAFWAYTWLTKSFLSGELTGNKLSRDEEFLETKEYGRGHYFKPIFILSNKKGKKLQKDIKKIESNHLIDITKINSKYQKKINFIVKDYIKDK